MQTIENSRISLPDSLLATLATGETVAVQDSSGIIAFIVPSAVHGVPRPCGLAKGEFSVPDDFNAPDPEIEALIYGES
jgi:antitoxin (DNA-binding transcriptional repressor) of toxin-antitoxin stability system